MHHFSMPLSISRIIIGTGVCILFSITTGFLSKPEKGMITPTNDSLVAKVSILGVFHFGGSSQDMASMYMPDPFGERRQADISNLVSKLADFKPTKILVEYPKHLQIRLDEKYQSYLLGKDTLSVNETEQVGFRLAKLLGHSKLYAIDYSLDLPGDGLFEYCQRNDKMSEFEDFISNIRSYVSNENKILDTMSISSYLARTNVDAIDQFTNETYVGKILNWGDSVNEAGARFAATWWERNMVILRNIAQTIENKEERVLVIIGSGHRAVLKDLMINRSDMEYVEISNYLK